MTTPCFATSGKILPGGHRGLVKSVPIIRTKVFRLPKEDPRVDSGAAYCLLLRYRRRRDPHTRIARKIPEDPLLGENHFFVLVCRFLWGVETRRGCVYVRLIASVHWPRFTGRGSLAANLPAALVPKYNLIDPSDVTR